MIVEEVTSTSQPVQNGQVPSVDLISPPSRPGPTSAPHLAVELARPLLKGETWLALAFVVTSGVASVFWFTLLLLLGLVISPFLIPSPARPGTSPIVARFFRFSRSLSVIEASLALWAGRRIDVRPLPAGDSERSRFAGFIATNALTAPVLAAVALAPAITLIVFLAVGLGWLGLPIYAGLLVAWPHVVLAVAQAKGRLLDWFLGPDRLAEAEQRVSVLSGQRDDILDAVAAERRRIERNLHDGVQQQLIAIGLDLGRADTKFDDDPPAARQLVSDARTKVQGAIGELRQLGRGLHPAILEDRGLDAALSAVVSQSPVPITLAIDDNLDLGTEVQSTAYLIINEAVANMLKHANARAGSIAVARVGANVRIIVNDDGHGGANVADGHGLAGIRARVHGADGVMTLHSPAGGPTSLTIELPRHD